MDMDIILGLYRDYKYLSNHFESQELFFNSRGRKSDI